MKKHIVENYEIKNLNSTSKQIAVDLRAKLLAAIEGSLSEIEYLKSSLQNYKGVLNDFADMSIENADIISKYRYNPTSSSFNLPGVFASTVGSYDLESMSADNNRLSELKDDLDEIDTQQQTYYKMMIGNANDTMDKIRQIKKYHGLLSQFLQQLQTSLDME